MTKSRSGKAGRAKGAAELGALARQHTELAIRTLAEICRDADKTAAARVSAASLLLERGYGKTPQAAAGEDREGPVRAEITVTFVRPDGRG